MSVSVKTSKGERIKNPSSFEIETLKVMCSENDCTMEMLIDAIHSNYCSEPISCQVHYLKTGEIV
jgi:hypothetical protein